MGSRRLPVEIPRVEADDLVQRHVEGVGFVLEVVVADEDQTRLDAEALDG